MEKKDEFKGEFGGWGYSIVVECLFDLFKVLCLNFSIVYIKKI